MSYREIVINKNLSSMIKKIMSEKNSDPLMWVELDYSTGNIFISGRAPLHFKWMGLRRDWRVVRQFCEELERALEIAGVDLDPASAQARAYFGTDREWNPVTTLI